MLYTNYFSSVVKQQGPPNLNPDQYRRMMNIVFVEGMIQGIKKIKEKEMSALFKYDMMIFRHQKTLTGLTGNLHPKELIREMYTISAH